MPFYSTAMWELIKFETSENLSRARDSSANDGAICRASMCMWERALYSNKTLEACGSERGRKTKKKKRVQFLSLGALTSAENKVRVSAYSMKSAIYIGGAPAAQ